MIRTASTARVVHDAPLPERPADAMRQIPETSAEALIERYDALLIDAYGVLVDTSGALEGAAAFIARLNQLNKPYRVLTNDASRTLATSARRLASLGLDVGVGRIITSASLIGPYFAQHGLSGARCVVLGPGDSQAVVAEAGGQVVGLEGAGDGDVDALIVCDDAGYDFLRAVEGAISLLMRRLDAGRPVRLLLPNPDLIYPKAAGAYGVTSGGVAHLIEAALAVRFPGCPEACFDRLGKPHAPIYEAAIRDLGTSNAVMIGDQLGTDVRGARAFGLDAALILSGLGTAVAASALPPEQQPTWLLPGLR